MKSFSPIPQVPAEKESVSGGATRIWQEIPERSNPYLAAECRCHGYDILELAQKRSFIDVLFLLFQGELPAPSQAKVLETLFISLINPGPRHPAVRAAMNAGVGKTDSSHILSIGLSVLSGTYLGSREVQLAMRFLAENLPEEPKVVAEGLLKKNIASQGDTHIAPGFGSRFAGIDPLPQKVAILLAELDGSGRALHWGSQLVASLHPHNMGWLSTGLAAAVFIDLSFTPWAGAGLFQLMQAPGILAHGLEFSGSPLHSLPFLDKDHYVITPAAQKA